MPKPKLSFPPLVQSQQWTVKSEASWPGAEYTRRSRLQTHLHETYNSDFMDEMQQALGKEKFLTFQEAMQPQVATKMPRGKPPTEYGLKPIKASYTLRRKQAEGEESTLEATLASTTTSLSGRMSKTKFHDTMQSQFGPAPSYLWEDREQLETMSEWFDKYGRPEPNPLNKGLYTHWEPSSRRCCGEPSNVQKMVKGSLTG
jgi:hypothetical protein